MNSHTSNDAGKQGQIATLLRDADNLEKYASRRGWSGVLDREKAAQLREQAKNLSTPRE